jgi:hypothetical protein
MGKSTQPKGKLYKVQWPITNILYFIILFFALLPPINAQKAADVLENGIKAGPRDKLIIDPGITGGYDGRMMYDLWSINSTAFDYLDDSVIIVVPRGAMTILARPLNPLNYSYNTSVTFSIIIY